MVRDTLTLDSSAKINVRNLNIWYGDHHAIIDNSMTIRKNNVTALIGPSGCGKSTFLRALNRMNDFIDDCVTKGSVDIDGTDIYRTQYTNVNNLRKSVGMVFQKPNPFPKSIYDNVAYGPRIHGLSENKEHLDVIVEESLKRAGLWQEVSDRLQSPGTGLSGGQQQRVAIARALVNEPSILFADEPTGNLDSKTGQDVMKIFKDLNKNGQTIILITHEDSIAKQSNRIITIMDGLIESDFRE